MEGWERTATAFAPFLPPLSPSSVSFIVLTSLSSVVFIPTFFFLSENSNFLRPQIILLIPRFLAGRIKVRQASDPDPSPQRPPASPVGVTRRCHPVSLCPLLLSDHPQQHISHYLITYLQAYLLHPLPALLPFLPPPRGRLSRYHPPPPPPPLLPNPLVTLLVSNSIWLIYRCLLGK